MSVRSDRSSNALTRRSDPLGPTMRSCTSALSAGVNSASISAIALSHRRPISVSSIHSTTARPRTRCAQGLVDDLHRERIRRSPVSSRDSRQSDLAARHVQQAHAFAVVGREACHVQTGKQRIAETSPHLFRAAERGARQHRGDQRDAIAFAEERPEFVPHRAAGQPDTRVRCFACRPSRTASPSRDDGRAPRAGLPTSGLRPAAPSRCGRLGRVVLGLAPGSSKPCCPRYVVVRNNATTASPAKGNDVERSPAIATAP